MSKVIQNLAMVTDKVTVNATATASLMSALGINKGQPQQQQEVRNSVL